MTEWAGWRPLRDSGLHARALRVDRVAVAFFKHLFESYEEVGIVRTVETHGDGTVSIAILVPADFTRIAAGILEDLNRNAAARFTTEALPAVCTEDWFLATWTRADDLVDQGAADSSVSSPSAVPSVVPPERKT